MSTLKDQNKQYLSDVFKISTAIEDGSRIFEFKNPNEKLIIYDPGLIHTAICKTSISRIDLDNGRFYYRGYPVTEWVKRDFLDIALLLLNEKLCGTEEKHVFYDSIDKYFVLYPEIQSTLDTLPENIHPTDYLSVGFLSLGALSSKCLGPKSNPLEEAAFMIAQGAIITAYYYVSHSHGHWEEPLTKGSYAFRIAKCMHPLEDDTRIEKLAKILNVMMILHAEHGQNCSTAVVRLVESAHGPLYNAISSGIAAFKGFLHGGASQFVSEMYDEILTNNYDIDAYIDKKIANKEPLLGFGQRTYNRILNGLDPRVETMRKILFADDFDFPEVEPYKQIALKMIDRVSNDPYFKKRNITANPDLFNCILFKLFKVPSAMNPVMICLGRVMGWTANYYEQKRDSKLLIRPCDLQKSYLQELEDIYNTY